MCVVSLHFPIHGISVTLLEKEYNLFCFAITKDFHLADVPFGASTATTRISRSPLSLSTKES